MAESILYISLAVIIGLIVGAVVAWQLISHYVVGSMKWAFEHDDNFKVQLGKTLAYKDVLIQLESGESFDVVIDKIERKFHLYRDHSVELAREVGDKVYEQEKNNKENKNG